eukprot:TRINITY_DN18649_c0_g2_i1.p1 TRINITY_DN18649_c0_g2~~TRINITY_DN18649_c0_g2_i1.p1  ORF type:complete len:422 (-),score=81.52 TRINITY_DN18649_c0_g2_i1:112-1377(-)
MATTMSASYRDVPISNSITRCAADWEYAVRHGQADVPPGEFRTPRPPLHARSVGAGMAPAPRIMARRGRRSGGRKRPTMPAVEENSAKPSPHSSPGSQPQPGNLADVPQQMLPSGLVAPGPVSGRDVRFPPELQRLLDKECLDELLRSEQDTRQLFALLRGHVFALALDESGCRLVQQAIELADNAQLIQLLAELRHRVADALISPHANHVLQKAIAVARPAHVSFILEEMLQSGQPGDLARHQYGCRILERIIEHFPPERLEHFVGAIIRDAAALARHIYGCFVVQHLLEHGLPLHRRFIIDAICEDIHAAATHQHASGVLDKALTYTKDNLDRWRLVEKLVYEEGLLVAMASHRSGFAATQQLFKVLATEGFETAPGHLQEARDALRRHVKTLERAKHGRALLGAVLPEFADEDYNKEF